MEAPSWRDGIKGQAAVEIAVSDNTPMRVQAGPGTGKTFAIKRRVWRLLEEGKDPGRILVCTFARTAANDLRREMRELGVEGIEDIQATTLHSYCFGVLQRNEIIEQYNRDTRVLLDPESKPVFEKKIMLNDIKEENEEFGDYNDCRDLLRGFEAGWARLQSEDPGWPTDPLDQHFEHVLEDWLRFHGGMLLEEIVYMTYRYLRDNPNCPERSSFEHVIVDEYQDLNRAEQEVLMLLSENSSYVIVGDEDQSIYSFKHAYPEGIRNFDAVVDSDINDVSLETCIRCPQGVVDIADNLIGRNENRAPRQWDADPDNPEGEVSIVQWSSIEEEGHGLAEYMNHQIESGEVEAGKVLVLAPREEFGRAVQQGLEHFNVDNQNFFHSPLDGNPKKLDESRSQQAMTILRLLADPGDRIALRCWCGFGSQSFRSGSWDRVRNYCISNHIEPIEALQSLVNGEISIPHAHHLIDRAELLFSRLEKLSGLEGEDLLHSLFPPSEEWAKPHISAAETIQESRYGPDDLWITLREHAIRPQVTRDVDFVRIMSLYKSKGLTADLVIIPGCIQGSIPFIKSDISIEEERRHLREQRRLFYVSITRTRNKLVLSSVTNMSMRKAASMRLQYSGYGEDVNTMSSQFINDLGRDMPIPITGREFLENNDII